MSFRKDWFLFPLNWIFPMEASIGSSQYLRSYIHDVALMQAGDLEYQYIIFYFHFHPK